MDGFSRDKESTTTGIVYTKHIQVCANRLNAHINTQRHMTRPSHGNYPMSVALTRLYNDKQFGVVQPDKCR